jgi:hypothetical protein
MCLHRFEREVSLRADLLSNHPEQIGSQISGTAMEDILSEHIRCGTDNRVRVSPALQNLGNEPEVPAHASDALTTTWPALQAPNLRGVRKKEDSADLR